MSPVPAASDLEARAARIRAVDFALIGIVLAADAWMLWRLIATGNSRILIISFVLLSASAAVYLAAMLQFFTVPGKRVRHLRLPETVGRYPAGEIQRMVIDLLQPHRGREQPAVFIVEPKYAGAFVTNSLFFNFLKPLNAIYISRHLFTILKPGEIKAVLAHELAHFHRYMRPLGRTQFVLFVFNALLPVQLATPDRGPVPLSTVFLAWLVLSAVMTRTLGPWLNRHSRSHEFLCDLQAARRYGILNTVNGLLGVARTFEVQFVLQSKLLREIRRDDTLSLQQLPALFEILDRALPNKPVDAGELDTAIAHALASPALAGLRKTQSIREQKQEAKQVDAVIEAFMLNREFAVLDWRAFDNITPDGRVDAAEYPQLIRLLEEEPDRQLLALPTDHAPTVANGSHPTLRERILFLERCRREDPTLPLG